MPLIIQANERNAWIIANTREEVQTFVRPFPNGILQAHKILYKVTAARGLATNVPEVQQACA